MPDSYLGPGEQGPRSAHHLQPPAQLGASAEGGCSKGGGKGLAQEVAQSWPVPVLLPALPRRAREASQKREL